MLRGKNMFIGFTAVTGTSRMSWECKHRPLDRPFLTTSHSSLASSLLRLHHASLFNVLDGKSKSLERWKQSQE